MDKAVLSVDNLEVSYDAKVVLSGVFLELKRKEFVAVVGPSGCGKTTLLNAIAGFINYKGKVVSPNNKAYVFQQHTLFPWMTVGENIIFGMQGLDKNERKRIISGCLKLTNLFGFESRLPSQLSGGQQQRVAVARALARKSELLLMDEPFASLDNKMRSKMQCWLLKILKKSNTSVLFVTHNIEEAVFLADRILVLGANSVLKEVDVPFPHPRTEFLKYTKAFNLLKRKIDALAV